MFQAIEADRSASVGSIGADPISETSGLEAADGSRFAEILQSLLRFEGQRENPSLAQLERYVPEATVIQGIEQFAAVHDPEYQPAFGPRRRAEFESLVAMLLRESLMGEWA